MKTEQLYKDRVSKTTPVIETTIEGAHERITKTIEWMEWFIGAMGKAMEDDGYPASTLSSLRTMATNLEYIAVFIDTVGDEMAAISSSYNSLHDRYVEALANRMTYWSAYNEIDQRIYDGTPLFDNYEEAQHWLSEQVNVRPSTGIIHVWVKPFQHTFHTANDNK